MNAERHPLVERMARAQLDRRSAAEIAAERTIQAQEAFTRQRVLAESHAIGRKVIAWAIEHRCAHVASVRALRDAIDAGRLVALLLMDCWADFPECQEIA